MTLLLDIDYVLIDWSGRRGVGTGFDDFVRPELKYFNYYSPTQLKLIADSFEDIRWHTTWIDQRMVDTLWTPNTGFGPYPIAVDDIQGIGPLERGYYCNPSEYDEPIRVNLGAEVNEKLSLAHWWKLNAVAALLSQGKLTDKTVWVDDQIAQFRRAVLDVLEHYDAVDRFRLYAPTQVWTRTDIEEAAEWAKS